MKNEELKKIYEGAIELWGEDSQLMMVVEECGELIQAIAKFHRKKDAKTIDNICEEVADVQIMLDQMKIMFSEDEINRHLKTKRARLKERVFADNVAQENQILCHRYKLSIEQITKLENEHRLLVEKQGYTGTLEDVIKTINALKI